MNPLTKHYAVANLKKFTKYEFFLAPFYRSVEGQPSNSKVVQTFEDGMWIFNYNFVIRSKKKSYSSVLHIPHIFIKLYRTYQIQFLIKAIFYIYFIRNPFRTTPLVPSSPPDNVQIGMLNLTAGWVRWLPPPPQHHNGLLLGYKIQVCCMNDVTSVWWFLHTLTQNYFRISNWLQVKAGNTSKVLAQMTLNATTMSVMLNNLTTGAVYNVRVVAYTRVGAGPYSMPVCVRRFFFS